MPLCELQSEKNGRTASSLFNPLSRAALEEHTTGDAERQQTWTITAAPSMKWLKGPSLDRGLGCKRGGERERSGVLLVIVNVI